MKSTVENLIIDRYNVSSLEETRAALREILQSIVLIGLSHGDFFERASFYGDTALRMFYGLNRYSEDLDFTLNCSDTDFALEPYTKNIIEVANSYGLHVEIALKEKKIKTPIESAFAKVDAYQTVLDLHLSKESTKSLHKDERIKVKFEVDRNPALGFKTERKWIDSPEFAPVIVLDQPSLFAGKLHAILCRNYKNSVKGRDYYDLLFYICHKIKPNMTYLKNKLVVSNQIDLNQEFDSNVLKKMLKERIMNVDFDQVKADASKFVFQGENLSYYSKDLFLQMIEKIQ